LSQWEGPLQRLFSTFPGGGPGVGLLLFRMAVGGGSAIFGARYLSGSIEHTPAVWAIALIFVLAGAALVVGLMTQLASLLVGLCMAAVALSWVPVPASALIGCKWMALGVVVLTIGIALLGPGAFSVDGYLFGYREIVIPPRPPES
jgi:uncharacterized membrane protein YphA (DoxX/SURF4 family)